MGAFAKQKKKKVKFKDQRKVYKTKKKKKKKTTKTYGVQNQIVQLELDLVAAQQLLYALTHAVGGDYYKQKKKKKKKRKLKKPKFKR